MTRMLLLSLTLALTTAACGKDKKDGDTASSAKTGEPAAGPIKIAATDLFADFTTNKIDGMALLDKYREGATFTAKVKTVGAEESGKPIVMLDVDGKNMISLDFKDPAKGKAAKVGDSLTVTCKIGGASGRLMMALDCT